MADTFIAWNLQRPMELSLDGWNRHESIDWLVHKWKKNLARTILSSLMGQCCDVSHKQGCRKNIRVFFYLLRPLQASGF